MPDSTTEQVLLSLSGMLTPAPAPEASPTSATIDNAPATPNRGRHGLPPASELPETTCTDRNDKLVPGQPVHMIRTLTLSDAVDGETLSLLRDLPSATGQDDDNDPGPRRVLARVHVLQLQPTDRPIEDRFSIRLTRSGTTAASAAAGTTTTGHDPATHLAGPAAAAGTGRSRTSIRLQLGVYDGHRGPWAAQHVAATLPERLDGIDLASSAAAAAAAGDPEAVGERFVSAFRALDGEMLDSFTRAEGPDLLASKGDQRRRRLLGLVGLGAKKDQGKEGRDKPSVLDDGLPALRAVSGCTACLLLLDWDLDDLTKETVEDPTPTDEVGLVDPKTTAAVEAARTACRCALINLGDSRAVVADLHNSDRHHPDPSSADTPTKPKLDLLLRQTSDVNSSVASERAHILRQHPLDDPRDVVIGGRLFGETLSTRAFGDAHYKLPVREPAGEQRRQQQLNHRKLDGEGGKPVGTVPWAARLSTQERKLHRHHVQRMSARLLAAAQADAPAQAARARTLTLEERYEAMFSSYHTPPYVSAAPDVQVWSEAAAPGSAAEKDEGVAGGGNLPDGCAAARCEEGVEGSARRVCVGGLKSRRMLGVLATDGLWDLVSSEEAVAFLQRTVTVASLEGNEKSGQKEVVNLAGALLKYVVEEKGGRPGDDITVLVVEYDISGRLDI